MDGGHATSPHTALDSSALRCFFLYSELKINAPNNTILSLSAFILAAVLVRELKKVDDKELIIDVQRPAWREQSVLSPFKPYKGSYRIYFRSDSCKFEICAGEDSGEWNFNV